jgi:hypothetical protein
MIKYSLLCDECNAKFDGWFPNSKEFDNQQKKKQVQCPMCDSYHVNKALMSPSIRKQSKKSKIEKAKEEITGNTMMPASQAKNIMRRIGKYVTKNFEDVGDNFYNEAKKSANGDRDDKFYGTPTENEVNELLDDGIDLFHVPKVKDN